MTFPYIVPSDLYVTATQEDALMVAQLPTVPYARIITGYNINGAANSVFRLYRANVNGTLLDSTNRGTSNTASSMEIFVGAYSTIVATWSVIGDANITFFQRAA